MSRRRVTPSELAEAIRDELENYKDYVAESMRADVRTAAQEARKEVRSRAPVHSGAYTDGGREARKPGTYKKSWKYSYQTTDANRARAVVYASGAEYRLTHLLEKGHAIRRGGRKVGEARPIEHIGPAQELAEQVFMREFRKSVERGE